MGDEHQRLTLDDIVRAERVAYSDRWRYKYVPGEGFYRNTVPGDPEGPEWARLHGEPHGEVEYWFHGPHCDCDLCVTTA
jgi:hypothetical protein